MDRFSKILILLFSFLLCSCATFEFNGPLKVFAKGVAAIIQSQEDAQKCSHGHAQDRINCREKKGSDVRAITQSIEKHVKETKQEVDDSSISPNVSNNSTQVSKHHKDTEPEAKLKVDEVRAPKELTNTDSSITN